MGAKGWEQDPASWRCCLLFHLVLQALRNLGNWLEYNHLGEKASGEEQVIRFLTGAGRKKEVI